MSLGPNDAHNQSAASDSDDAQRHEFIKEVERLGVGEGLIAVQLRPEYGEAFTFAPEIVFLPQETLLMVMQDGLSRELLSVGLKQTVAQLRVGGPSKVLASSLISSARSSSGYDPWEREVETVLEAIHVYESLGCKAELGRAYVDLGASLVAGGLRYEGLRAYEKAIAILVGVDDRLGVSVAMIHKARLATELSLYSEAIRILQEAERLLPEGQSRQQWESEILHSRGRLLALLGKNSDALEEVERWIATEEATRKNKSSFASLRLRARLQVTLNNIDSAMNDYASAVNAAFHELLDFRTQAFRWRRRQVIDGLFREAVTVSVQQKNYDLGFGVLERSKTISAFLATKSIGSKTILAPDAMNRLRDITSEGVKENQQRRQHELTNLISRAISAIASQDSAEKKLCNEVAEGLVAQTQYTTPRVRTFEVLPPLESLRSAVQAQLPQGALLLEYVFVENSLWVFALTHRTISIYPCEIERFELSILVESAYQECAGVIPTYALDNLAQRLLGPVQRDLEQVKLLIVVPIPELFGIPFHAMSWRSEPLLTRMSVAYSPSSLLIAARKPAHPNGFTSDSRCLLIGVPSVTYADVEKLSEIIQEIDLVSQGFKSPRGVTGERATSEVILNVSAETEIIHLACHAVTEPSCPLLSRILMSDRPVFAFELLASGVKARLVVLNACHTADARMHATGDSEGLSSSFLLAGAETVVSTAWPVSDKAAAVFARELYGELLARGQSPLTATRSAQLAVKRSEASQHPYHWAPFTVLGGVGYEKNDSS